jgi:hypothetical protein
MIISLLIAGCQSQSLNWEYKILNIDNIQVGPFGYGCDLEHDGYCYTEDASYTTNYINELGGEGWELVNFVHNPGDISTVLIFKRPAE